VLLCCYCAKPFSVTVGLVTPLWATDIVTERVTPLAELVFVKVTTTVHVPPGAKVTPVQLSVAFVNIHVVALPPTGTVTPVTVTLAPPAAAGLVSVTVPLPDRGLAPAGSVMVSGLGLPVRAWTPVPESVTGELTTVALPVIASDPVAAPTAVGENCTLIVQVAPDPSVVPQFAPPPPAREKGPVNVAVRPVNAAAVVLLNVRVWNALVVPVACAPKVSDAGVTVTAAVPVPVPVSATGVPVTVAPV